MQQNTPTSFLYKIPAATLPMFFFNAQIAYIYILQTSPEISWNWHVNVMVTTPNQSILKEPSRFDQDWKCEATRIVTWEECPLFF